MVNFHETGYGRTFFQGQLPSLIKNTGEISKKLEEQNQKIEALTAQIETLNNMLYNLCETMKWSQR